jgi:hypothetical protein
MQSIVRSLALGIILVAATSSFARETQEIGAAPGMARIKQIWVQRVTSHVRATNDYHRSYGRPEKVTGEPETWAELPAIFKSPRIMRQLRAIAKMPEVALEAGGLWLVGRDAGREVKRSIHANGNGASIDTGYRGGQGPRGGQSWMLAPVTQPLEETAMAHFWMRGERAAQKTGKPAGERLRRNVDRKPEALEGLAPFLAEALRHENASGQ